MITFTIPGEPQGKARARAVRGNHYTPEKTVAYEQSVAWAGKAAMRGRAPMAGPVRLSFTAVFQIPGSASKGKRQGMRDGLILPTKKPDIDNILKAVADGLNKVAFNDDAQIVSLGEVRKIYGETPCVVVSVEPVTEARAK